MNCFPLSPKKNKKRAAGYYLGGGGPLCGVRSQEGRVFDVLRGGQYRGHDALHTKSTERTNVVTFCGRFGYVEH